MVAQPATLDYAKKLSASKKRIRQTTYVFLFLAIAFVCWQWGKPTWNHVQLIYWQNNCLNYRMPNDAPVASVEQIPNHPWNRFYQYFSPPGLRQTNLLWLGELQAKSSERRLVSVSYSQLYMFSQSSPLMQMESQVIIPAGMLTNAKTTSINSYVVPADFFSRLNAIDLKISNALPVSVTTVKDQSDSSHLICIFKTQNPNAKSLDRIIDIWLKDEQLVFEPRP